MKNLKTVGKVVVLTALVATQANAWEVPGWNWAQENIMNPVLQKGSDALEYVKNIQWKDKVENGVVPGADGEYNEYAEITVKGVGSKLASPFVAIWNATKSVAGGAKHYTVDQLTRKNAKKVYNVSADAVKGAVSASWNATKKVAGASKDFAKNTAASSWDATKGAYNTVVDKGKAFGSSALEQGGKLVDGTKEIAKKARDIAVENPKTSIAIGAGVVIVALVPFAIRRAISRHKKRRIAEASKNGEYVNEYSKAEESSFMP